MRVNKINDNVMFNSFGPAFFSGITAAAAYYNNNLTIKVSLLAVSFFSIYAYLTVQETLLKRIK
jgi:hypothetical protein